MSIDWVLRATVTIAVATLVLTVTDGLCHNPIGTAQGVVYLLVGYATGKVLFD